MTSEDIQIVRQWLMRRFEVCTSDVLIAFLPGPINKDQLEGAKKLYQLLLNEATNEILYPT